MNDTFKTTDFDIAVILVTMGIKIHKFEKIHPKKLAFHFEEREECEKIQLDYYNGHLMVEPREFWNNIRQVKSVIYDKLQN